MAKWKVWDGKSVKEGESKTLAEARNKVNEVLGYKMEEPLSFSQFCEKYFPETSSWFSNDILNLIEKRITPENGMVKLPSYVDKVIPVTPIKGYEEYPIFRKVLNESKEQKSEIKAYDVSYEMSLNELRETPSFISVIENPTKEMIDAAIEGDPTIIIKMIGTTTEDDIIKAVKVDWKKTLSNLPKEKITEKVLNTALEISGDAIEYAPVQNELLCWKAIKKTPSAIRFVKNATFEMKLDALKNDRSVVKYV